MQPLQETQSGWLSSLVSRRFFAVAVLATCGMILAVNYADADLWGHVLYGQEIIRDGALPTTTTWSYTANGYRWINHENVAELVMAFAVNQFGPMGLIIGKYLFSWALIGMIYWRARVYGVSPIIAAFVCLFVALTIEFHWHFRPQIFGYVFFGIMCSLLFWCFHQSAEDEVPLTTQSYRLKHLFWLVPLSVLWTNTHGSFAAGIAIASAYLGLKFVEIFIHGIWKESVPEIEAKSAKRSLYILFFVVLAMLLCTLVNPYGTGLHLWLLGALGESRPEISDWKSPSLFIFSREVSGLWLILITTAIAMKTSPQKDWPRIIVFLLLTTQAVSHIRHLALLAIMWGSWFAVDINQCWQRFLTDLRSKATTAATDLAASETNSRPILVQATLCFWIVGAGVLSWAKMETLIVPRDRFPVDALKFMADHRLEGRTYVTFNWAQYAIGVFANEKLDSTVAFDGRFRTCYPQEVIDIYFDFMFGEDYTGPRHRSPKSGAVDGSRALSYKDPELFLINTKEKSSVKTMQDHQEEWALLYEDEFAQVWGKRNKYNSFKHVVSRPYGEKAFISERPKSPAAWPAFASGTKHAKADKGIALQN